MTRASVAAVVLAAGSSRRAGAANKLLWPVDGEAMIRRVVRRAEEAGLVPRVVVTGHEARRISECLAGRSVTLVHNPHHEQGMGGSLACGVSALPEEAGAALILLGDMPFVRVSDLTTLAAALSSSDRAIAVPVFGSRRGNPVGFGAAHFPALRGLRGDQGARAVLRAHASCVSRVAVGHDGILRDVDCKEALELQSTGGDRSRR